MANRIWVINVGDLKPYELNTEFFLSYAWDSSPWTYDNLDTFVSSWAQREFDVPLDTANEIANIMTNLTRWNNRRKPELLNGTTYSLTNYRECETSMHLPTKLMANLQYRAEMVVNDWEGLLNSSTKIYNSLPSEYQAAFFEMVQHPILASTTLTKMWIASGTNNLRISQARLSANDYATQVEQLFEMDYQLETEYHQLLDGKWDQCVFRNP